MIKGAIFDLDGTLLDTLKSLSNSVNYALLSNGLSPLDESTISSFIGNGVKKLVERSLAYLNATEKLDATFSCFLESYSSNALKDTYPFKDIPSLLLKLNKKNIQCFVITNKNTTSARKLITHFFPNMFLEIIGEDSGFLLKPNSNSISFILNKYKLNSDEVLFIGDSEVDLKTSMNANIPFIGVSWGYGNLNNLLSSTKIISQPLELLDII